MSAAQRVEVQRSEGFLAPLPPPTAPSGSLGAFVQSWGEGSTQFINQQLHQKPPEPQHPWERNIPCKIQGGSRVLSLPHSHPTHTPPDGAGEEPAVLAHPDVHLPLLQGNSRDQSRENLPGQSLPSAPPEQPNPTPALVGGPQCSLLATATTVPSQSPF